MSDSSPEFDALSEMLDGVEKAEHTPGKSGGVIMTMAEKTRYMAPLALRMFLQGEVFSAALAYSRISELNEAYQTPKALGDCLGAGSATSEHPNGHPDGLGLHRSRAKRTQFPAVYENAVLCLKAVRKHGLLDNFLAEQEITVERLMDDIKKLPRV